MGTSIVEAHVGETPIVRGYIVDETDVALTQAAISSMAYNVVDLDAVDPTASIASGSMVVVNVIYDSTYTHNSRTWNMRWIQPAAVVVADHTTRTIVTVITTGGLTIIEPVEVKGLAI